MTEGGRRDVEAMAILLQQKKRLKRRLGTSTWSGIVWMSSHRVSQQVSHQVDLLKSAYLGSVVDGLVRVEVEKQRSDATYAIND